MTANLNYSSVNLKELAHLNCFSVHWNGKKKEKLPNSCRLRFIIFDITPKWYAMHQSAPWLNSWFESLPTSLLVPRRPWYEQGLCPASCACEPMMMLRVEKYYTGGNSWACCWASAVTFTRTLHAVIRTKPPENQWFVTVLVLWCTLHISCACCRWYNAATCTRNLH